MSDKNKKNGGNVLQTGTALFLASTLVPAAVHGCSHKPVEANTAPPAEHQPSSAPAPSEAGQFKQTGGYVKKILSPGGQELTLAVGTATEALAKKRSEKSTPQMAANGRW